MVDRIIVWTKKVVPINMQTEDAMTATLTPDDVTKMTELKENPFANRILEVFSEDSSGHVTFNNFVDMFNVFSEHAPRDLKKSFWNRPWTAHGPCLAERFTGQGERSTGVLCI